MYSKIITPSEKNHTVIIPKKLYGKKVKVVMNEVEAPLAVESDSLSLVNTSSRRTKKDAVKNLAGFFPISLL